MLSTNEFLSEEHEKRIQDFTVYANFIANEFKIQVVLDTHHAHTDGKVISLPNVTNLSEEELDAMYAILLHEAGHIRYSNFSDEYFANFRTHMEAFFANCFEDARIENMLCNDFSGALNIFENLYTKHAINPAIKHRLFGFQERHGDQAFAFGAFLHNIKCDFATAELAQIDPTAKKVIKILNSHPEFISLIQKHPLKTDKDTLAISMLAYEFFTKNFKDSTEKISFAEDKKVLEKMSAEFDALSSKTQVSEAEFEQARQERLVTQKAYKKAIADVEDEVEIKKQREKSLEKIIQSLNDLRANCSSHQTATNGIVNAQRTINRAEKSKEEILARMQRRVNAFEKAQNAEIKRGNVTNPIDTPVDFNLTNHTSENPFVNPQKDTGSPEINKRIDDLTQRLNSDLSDLEKKNRTADSKNTKVKEFESNIKETEKVFDAMANNISDQINQSTLPYSERASLQDILKEIKKNVSQFSENSQQTLQDASSKLAQEAQNSEESTADSSDSDMSQDGEGEGENQSAENNEVESSGNPSEAQSQQASGSGLSDTYNKNADSTLEKLGTTMENLRNSKNQVANEVATLLTPFNELRQKFDAARAAENTAEEKLNRDLMESFSTIHDIQSNSAKNYDSQVPFQNPLDMLFEETPEWDSSDEFQKEFDKIATKETGQFVVNGQKLAGTGAGNRSVSVLLNEMKDRVININLAECFKETVAGSLLEQGNDGGFENFGNEKGNTFNTESYIAKLQTTGRHTVYSTEFDKIENETIPKDSQNEARQLLVTRHLIVNRVKEQMAKKMKFSKKARYVGAKDEGDLDARNLWKIPARRGSDVFEQNNPKLINKVAASILVDISGSLNNDSTAEGRELKFVSAVLSEALTSCYVKHEVLGFHAPYSPELAAFNIDASYNRRNHYLETVVFKDFGQKNNEGIDNLSVQSSDNSDGESLRIAVKRLLKQRAKNRIIFMVTDAKPFLTGANVLKLDKDFYEALQEAKRKKVQVIGIGYNVDKTGIFGANYIHIKDASYDQLVEGVKSLTLKVD